MDVASEWWRGESAANSSDVGCLLTLVFCCCCCWTIVFSNADVDVVDVVVAAWGRDLCEVPDTEEEELNFARDEPPKAAAMESTLRDGVGLPAMSPPAPEATLALLPSRSFPRLLLRALEL